MERENRYLVLKRKDIRSALSSAENEILNVLVDKINLYRKFVNKDEVECVVVERDWPEYEPVWKMIEARVDSDSEQKQEPGEPEYVVKT